MKVAERPASPFERFGGRFILVRPMKQGASGSSLHLAYDESARDFVALKRLHKSVTRGQLGRFRDEEKIARQLDHPNIVRFVAHGEHDGWLFLAMEYLLGLDLQSLLRQAARLQEPIPLAVAGAIVAQLCSALEYAHDKCALIHRDIKPANIMVDRSGRAMLLDFGIAKSTWNLTRTRAGHLPGTLEYASPEQIAGESIDARSDLYSLGAVFWECITGQPPAHLSNEGTKPLPLLSSIVPVPKAVDDFAARVVHAEAARRFHSATEMRVASLACCGDSSPEKLAEFVGRFVDETQQREELQQLRVKVTELHASAGKSMPTLVVRPLQLDSGAPARGKRLAVVLALAIASFMIIGIVRLLKKPGVARLGAPPPARSQEVPAPEVRPPPAPPPENASIPAPIRHPPPPTPRLAPKSAGPELVLRRLKEADELARKGMYRSAEEAFDDLERVPQGSGFAAMGRADLYLQQRRFTESISTATSSLQSHLPPRYRARALVTRARAFLQTNDLEAAQRDFAAALALDPQSSVARQGLAAARASRAP